MTKVWRGVGGGGGINLCFVVLELTATKSTPQTCKILLLCHLLPTLLRCLLRLPDHSSHFIIRLLLPRNSIMSRKNSLLNLKASLPSGCARQYRQFCGLNEDGCYWPCGLRFSGGKRVSSTFPKSRPMLTARHRPKLPDTIRNFPTPSEISRHCPNAVRNCPTFSEISQRCPKLLDTVRSCPTLAETARHWPTPSQTVRHFPCEKSSATGVTKCAR